jgi:hypothetical protein
MTRHDDHARNHAAFWDFGVIENLPYFARQK